MPWSTTREDYIRRYCPAVSDDTTNWPDPKLQAYWDDAYAELKTELVPPLTAAAFDLLNGEDTHSKSGNILIARMAAWMIYNDLPGTDQEDQDRRKAYLDDKIAKIQSGDGEATLFDAAGEPLARDPLQLYHTHTGRR